MPSRIALYSSQLLSSWGDRMWEFASYIFLVDVFPDTLLPAALFGFIVEGSAIIFGPWLGRKIDSCNRLRAVRNALLAQNTSVACASVLFYAVLTRMQNAASYFIDSIESGNDSIDSGDGFINDTEKWYFFAGITLFAIFSKLATVSSEVAVQRDWAVLLSAGDKALLSRLNASLRRINLISKILAPILVGVLTEAWSTRGAVLTVACWNVVSLPCEYALIKHVYTQMPELAAPKGAAAAVAVVSVDTATKDANADNGTDDVLKVEAGESVLKVDKKETERVAQPSFVAPTTTLESWQLYARQPVFGASFAIALLYGSVINFGGPMVSYLKTEHGLSDLVLAACVGGGAVFGVISTFWFPHGVRRCGDKGVARFALWSFWSLAVSVLPTFVALLFFENDAAGVYMLVISIMFSRFALWSTDMAEAQVMQENVNPLVAGVVGTTERALMNGFMLLSYALTMVFHKPDTFKYAVAASVVFVVVAAVVYTVFYRNFEPLADEATPGMTAVGGDGDALVRSERVLVTASVDEGVSGASIEDIDVAVDAA